MSSNKSYYSKLDFLYSCSILIGSPKISGGQKLLWVQKLLGVQNYWEEKLLGVQNYWEVKLLGAQNYWEFKIIGSPKLLGVQKLYAAL